MERNVSIMDVIYIEGYILGKRGVARSPASMEYFLREKRVPEESLESRVEDDEL